MYKLICSDYDRGLHVTTTSECTEGFLVRTLYLCVEHMLEWSLTALVS